MLHEGAIREVGRSFPRHARNPFRFSQLHAAPWILYRPTPMLGNFLGASDCFSAVKAQRTSGSLA